MSLLEKREYFKPFSYPEAYEFWLTQQTSFWIHTEINMDADIYDWKFNLTDYERSVIGNILKSFVQSEILIGDYWRKVATVFEVPEIAMMASCFSSFETIHIAAYAYLNDTLGLQDFKEFLTDEIAMERLSRLSTPPTEFGCDDFEALDDEWNTWRKQLATSLAVFSAFGEGVALFSAFAILLSFAQRGLMRGLGEIIEMSIRDETLHSRAGMWLFNTFMSENKDLHDIKKHIYEAGRITVQIEDKFINSVFLGSSLSNCSPDNLKEFIRQRMNNQLREIHLKPEYRIDKGKVKALSWFNVASGGDTHADFFASKVTNYAKSDGWSDMWKQEK